MVAAGENQVRAVAHTSHTWPATPDVSPHLPFPSADAKTRVRTRLSCLHAPRLRNRERNQRGRRSQRRGVGLAGQGLAWCGEIVGMACNRMREAYLGTAPPPPSSHLTGRTCRQVQREREKAAGGAQSKGPHQRQVHFRQFGRSAACAEGDAGSDSAVIPEVYPRRHPCSVAQQHAAGQETGESIGPRELSWEAQLRGCCKGAPGMPPEAGRQHSRLTWLLEPEAGSLRARGPAAWRRAKWASCLRQGQLRGRGR